jgi:nicotinamidase-related amidase
MAFPTDYLREVNDPSISALIMWDFQVGLAGRALDLEQLVAVNRRLLAAADTAGVPVIWSRHTLAPPALETPGIQTFMLGKQGVASVDEIRPFMLVGSPEREFLPDIHPREHDLVIAKHTPSFFVGTPLEQRLRAMGRTTLVFTGVATEIGVDLSAKHGLALGYVPMVVEDAVGSYTVEKKEAGLAALRTWIPVVTADQIIGFWENAS